MLWKCFLLINLNKIYESCFSMMIMNNSILLFWKCIIDFICTVWWTIKTMFWIVSFGNLPNSLSSCNLPLYFFNFLEFEITPTDKHSLSSSKPTLWLDRLPLQSWYIYILIFCILEVWIICSDTCTYVIMETTCWFCCVVWII